MSDIFRKGKDNNENGKSLCLNSYIKKKVNRLSNKVYKKHLLTIDISARTRQVITTNTTFWTRDIGTGKFSINFVSLNQPVDLTGAMVLLGFYFENGSSKLLDSEEGSVVIEDAQQGRCHVIMPSYQFDYSGPVLIHVYLYYDQDNQLDCATVATEFERSWIDQKLPEMELYYVKRIEDWLAEVEAETNKIKSELAARLNVLKQEIDIIQTQANDIQDQIKALDIVTQEEFNHLNLNARNMILNSHEIISQGNEIDNQLVTMTIAPSQRSLLSNAEITFTFDWEAIGDHTSGRFRAQMQGSSGAGRPWAEISPSIIISEQNKKGTAVSTTGILGNYVWNFIDFRQDQIPTTVTMRYSNIRLQLGNKDLGWLPAPEDMATQANLTEGLNTRLALTGGNLTGNLISNGLIRSTAISGLQVMRPEFNNSGLQLDFVNGNNARARLIGDDATMFSIANHTGTAMAQFTLDKATFRGSLVANDPITAPRLIGNADTATRLLTSRQINGINFDGSQNITITANPTLTTRPVGSDLNDVVANGFYQGQNLVNRPPAVSGRHTWDYIVCVRHNNDNVIQMVTDFNNIAAFKRVMRDGIWRDWVKMVDENGGNAVSATRLQTPRSINLTGAITGSVNFDGTANVTINTSFANRALAEDSVAFEVDLYQKMNEFQKELEALKAVVTKLEEITIKHNH